MLHNTENDDGPTNDDLRTKQFSIGILEKYVLNFEIRTLVNFQHLDADFCKKYILNNAYQTVEESYLVTIDWILKRQPHLKYEDFIIV